MRAALVLGLENELLKEWESLMKIDKAAGRDTSGYEQRITERRAKLEATRKRVGVGKLSSFPKDGTSMMRAIGRDSDQIGHKLYSISSHGASLSLIMETIIDDKGSIGLCLLNTNPTYVAGVAWGTSEYLLEGAVAIAEMQEWSSLLDIRSDYERIESGFKTLIQGPENRD